MAFKICGIFCHLSRRRVCSRVSEIASLVELSQFLVNQSLLRGRLLLGVGNRRKRSAAVLDSLFFYIRNLDKNSSISLIF